MHVQFSRRDFPRGTRLPWDRKILDSRSIFLARCRNNGQATWNALMIYTALDRRCSGAHRVATFPRSGLGSQSCCSFTSDPLATSRTYLLNSRHQRIQIKIQLGFGRKTDRFIQSKKRFHFSDSIFFIRSSRNMVRVIYSVVTSVSHSGTWMQPDSLVLCVFRFFRPLRWAAYDSPNWNTCSCKYSINLHEQEVTVCAATDRCDNKSRNQRIGRLVWASAATYKRNERAGRRPGRGAKKPSWIRRAWK